MTTNNNSGGGADLRNQQISANAVFHFLKIVITMIGCSITDISEQFHES
jgi:hypothetical protein